MRYYKYFKKIFNVAVKFGSIFFLGILMFSAIVDSNAQQIQIGSDGLLKEESLNGSFVIPPNLYSQVSWSALNPFRSFNALICPLQNPPAGCNGFLNAVAGYMVNIAGMIAIFGLIWGGYQYMTASFRGSGEGTAQGMITIRRSLLGLTVVMVAIPFISNAFLPIFSSSGINVAPLVNWITTNIIGSMTGLASVFAMLAIVYGGYQYLDVMGFLGGGNNQEGGLRNIRYGVIGLTAVLIAQPIVEIYTNATAGTGGQLNSVGINALVTGLYAFIETNVVDNMITISSILSVFAIVYGGYLYLDVFNFLGGGGRQEGGMRTIQFGIVGLLATLLAKPVINLFVSSQNAVTNQLDLGTLASNIALFFASFINLLFIPLSSILTVVAFVVAGYYYIFAGDDSYRARSASQYAYYGVFGLLTILFSYTIVQILVFLIPQII